MLFLCAKTRRHMRSFFIFMLVAVLLFVSLAQPAKAVAIVDDAAIAITLLIFGALGITFTYATAEDTRAGVSGFINGFMEAHTAYTLSNLFPAGMVEAFLLTGQLVFGKGAEIWNEFNDWMRDTFGGKNGEIAGIVDGVNRLSQYCVVYGLEGKGTAQMQTQEVAYVLKYGNETDVAKIAESKYEIYGFYGDRYLQSGGLQYKSYFFISKQPFGLRIKTTTNIISGGGTDTVVSNDYYSKNMNSGVWSGYHILDASIVLGANTLTYTLGAASLCVDSYIPYNDYNGIAENSPMFQQAVISYMSNVGVLPPIDIPLDDIDISIPDEDSKDVVYAPPLPQYWKDVDILEGIKDDILDLIIEKIGTGEITVPGIDTLEKNPAIPGVDDPTIPDNPALQGELDLGPITQDWPSIKTVFPFSIPWDIAFVIQSFNATPEAPVFKVTFPAGVFKGNSVEWDMSQFEKPAAIVRWAVFILFIWGLLILTGKVIKW